MYRIRTMLKIKVFGNDFGIPCFHYSDKQDKRKSKIKKLTITFSQRLKKVLSFLCQFAKFLSHGNLGKRQAVNSFSPPFPKDSFNGSFVA